MGSGGFNSVYQTIWLDGPREKWNTRARQYVRYGEWRITLRSIDNSENDAEGFFDEVMHIPVKIFRVCLFETFNFLSSRKYSGNYE